MTRSKVLDDLIDIINYAAFIYCQLDSEATPVDVLVKAGETYIKRKDEYRDAWKKMHVDELVAGLRLKAGRIAAMVHEE
ncbi:MAG: hypothetical protein RMJ75_07360 [Nitrososphaerota archaeon]|nr:hypothetical protein [Nitrososphaerota archaeon]